MLRSPLGSLTGRDGAILSATPVTTDAGSEAGGVARVAGTVNDDLINVADFERAAAERLDAGVAGYFFGGACDEVTLGENVAAWRRWRLRPRMLAGHVEWTTRVEVLGAEVSMPILVAPVAYQRLVDPEGEVAMARAAAAAGTVMCLSTLATARPAEVAAAAPGGRRWFQLYCFRDAGVTHALLDEAVDAGFEAIVVTVDAPRGGRRERDLRTGFRIPEGLGVPSVQAALGSERAVTIEETFALMDPGLSWAGPGGARIRLRRASARQGGADRGGCGARRRARGCRCRRLQSRWSAARLRLATADALPEVGRRGRGSGRRPRRRRHPARHRRRDRPRARRRRGAGRPASALGARGRRGGGALRVLELLRGELELALALCGCSSPAELGRAHVRRAPSASVYSGWMTTSSPA